MYVTEVGCWLKFDWFHIWVEHSAYSLQQLLYEYDIIEHRTFYSIVELHQQLMRWCDDAKCPPAMHTIELHELLSHSIVLRTNILEVRMRDHTLQQCPL